MRPISLLFPICVILSVTLAAPLEAAEVVLTPEFRSIQLRGGGSVTVRPGASQRVTIVEGNSQVTRFSVDRNGQLRIDACVNRCPRHYALRIEIHSPSMPDAAISGGGTITASAGFRPQDRLSAAVSGGGQIDVRSVSAANLSAAVNGGGRVLTGRSSTLSGAVNGGGEIRYASTGKVSTVVNGGGTVRRAE
ncbi:MAG TPA: DUF2807 domain-containing protein [Sphingomicrobium sp.]|jgi:hypothetical protein|nr:DUF2807 domain-containing protein [Sphingomicrobium sp.]